MAPFKSANTIRHTLPSGGRLRYEKAHGIDRRLLR